MMPKKSNPRMPRVRPDRPGQRAPKMISTGPGGGRTSAKRPAKKANPRMPRVLPDRPGQRKGKVVGMRPLSKNR
jgi:hypothetical protein